MSFVTSVIPVYNGAKFLPKALQMLDRQTRRPDRIVVLDNCSTDATASIAQNCGIPGVKLDSNPKNIGMLGNFNRALDFSKDTDYLHILPVDDHIEPEFFARLLPLVETARGRALAYATAFTAEEGEPIPDRGARPGPPEGREWPLKLFLARQAEFKHICCPAVLLKTNREPPPCKFRSEVWGVADVVFFAEWARGCRRIMELPEVLSVHLHHPDSESNKLQSDAKLLRQYIDLEWQAMELISSWIDEDHVSHWFRWQKFKCLLAARSRVKMKLVGQERDRATAIRAAALQRISPWHWFLGTLAVWGRDRFYALAGRQPEAYRLAKGGQR